MEECFGWLTERCYGLAKATSKWPSPRVLPCLLFYKNLNLNLTLTLVVYFMVTMTSSTAFLSSFLFSSSFHCLPLLISSPSVCCLFSTSLICALSRTVSSAVPVVQYDSRGGCNQCVSLWHCLKSPSTLHTLCFPLILVTFRGFWLQLMAVPFNGPLMMR